MSAMPEREVEARVEWFLTTGDVRQWSGPDEQNPFPLMQEDFAAYLASAESRLLAAEARVREVEAAFKKYGDHWGQCPAITPRRKCNCGYDQARAILAREGA